MGTFRGHELDTLELTDELLQLRRWRREDAARVHEVMQDRSMHEFLALLDPYTPEVATHFVTDLGHEGRGDGTGVGCAIVVRSTGRLVGACALRLGTEPEIGYWIAPDSRGRGYGAHATRLLTDWAFVAGLPRVHLACDVRNLPSVRTAQNAGFAFEGVARDAVTGGGQHGIPERRFDLARFARLAGDPGTPVRPAFPPLPAGGTSDGVLALRTTSPDDAQGLFETDDELTLRWSFDGQPHSLAAARRETAQAGLNWFVGNRAMLAMIDAASGAYAGQLTLRHAGPPQIGGIGYVVHPAWRGRGFTTRALRLLVPWAFDAGYARLELGAKADNLASQRAAQSAGFLPDGVRQGRLRVPDGSSFEDEVRFVLLNPRPTAGRAARSPA